MGVVSALTILSTPSIHHQIHNLSPPCTLFLSLTVSVDRPWHSFHTVQKLPWHMTPWQAASSTCKVWKRGNHWETRICVRQEALVRLHPFDPLHSLPPFIDPPTSSLVVTPHTLTSSMIATRNSSSCCQEMFSSCPMPCKSPSPLTPKNSHLKHAGNKSLVQLKPCIVSNFPLSL